MPSFQKSSSLLQQVWEKPNALVWCSERSFPICEVYGSRVRDLSPIVKIYGSRIRDLSVRVGPIWWNITKVLNQFLYYIDPIYVWKQDKICQYESRPGFFFALTVSIIDLSSLNW